MLNRRLLVLTGIAIGLSFGTFAGIGQVQAFHRCCRCFPCTTTIYGDCGYRVSSRCANGQPYYQSYDIGIPHVPYDVAAPYSGPASQARSQDSRWSGITNLFK